MTWKLKIEFAVGGTTDIGFTSDSAFLIVASSQGRGLYETSTCNRIARDHEWPGNWHFGESIEGIGPLSGARIQVNGLDHVTPESILNQLSAFDLNSHITEFVAASISPDHRYLVIGYSSDVQLYEVI